MIGSAYIIKFIKPPNIDEIERYYDKILINVYDDS